MRARTGSLGLTFLLRLFPSARNFNCTNCEFKPKKMAKFQIHRKYYDEDWFQPVASGSPVVESIQSVPESPEVLGRS